MFIYFSMANQRTAVATPTTTNTKTKTVIATGALLLAGLGAYGFGFMPLLEQKGEDATSDARLACYDSCSSQRTKCEDSAKDKKMCEQPFQECADSCKNLVESAPEEIVYSEPVKTETTPVYEEKYEGKKEEVESSACLDQCAYDLKKCYTYQGSDFCEPQAIACRTTCSGSGATTPTSTTVEVGTLQIVAESMPPTSIIVPREGRGYPVARYRATAGPTEEVVISRISLANLSNPIASISDVMIEVDGTRHGSAFVSSAGSDVSVDLASNPLRIPAGGSVQFNVSVRLAPVSASAPYTPGVSSLAPEVRMGLANDPTSLRIEATGSLSRRPITVAIPSGIVGNPFIVRASMPIFGTAPGTGTTFVNGRLNLIGFQVSADSAGPVALKKMTFRLAGRTTGGAGFRLSDFSFLRNGIVMATSSVQIVNASGESLMNSSSTIAFPSANEFVTVNFTQEQTIEGSGQIFALRANASGVTSGAELRVEFERSLENSPRRNASLINQSAMSASYRTSPAVNFDIATPAQGMSSIPAPIIWSDRNAGDMHSDRFGTEGGSSDWTFDALLYGLDLSHTLRR